MTKQDPPQQSRFTLKVGDLLFPLQDERDYVVGCDTDCEIRLGHASVSPKHALLQVRGEEVRVADLGSQAGSSLDDEILPEHSAERQRSRVWAPGQTLQIGEIGLQLQTASAAAAAAGTTATIDPSKVQVPQATGREASFGDLMYEELKRAPWFALSALIHVGLILALYFLLPTVEPQESKKGVITMTQADDEEDVSTEDQVMPSEDAPEQEENLLTEQTVELQDSMPMDMTDAQVEEVGLDEGLLMSRVRSGSSGTDILKAGKGVLSGGFRKTVGEIRRTGLEIVFVFDSTGSMDAVLSATKRRIAKMSEVLHSLVPHARIGIVTYRDRGVTEDYLTRSVPLSHDFYRSVNFMQTIEASGGGDTPEAVDEALRVAKTQKWTKKSRRMIVLIGDAPPHGRTMRTIESMARVFTRGKHAVIHTIVTAPDGVASMSRQTERTFKKIAKAGRGSCLSFDEEEQILSKVLQLAFGPKHSKSLREVYKLVDKRNQRISRRVKDLLAKANPTALRREFSKKIVSPELIRAILKSPPRPVLRELVNLLRDRRLPAQGRHAIGYILRRVLHRTLSPVDPERPRPIDRRTQRRLLRSIERMG